jgi:hypothetical protein
MREGGGGGQQGQYYKPATVPGLCDSSVAVVTFHLNTLVNLSLRAGDRQVVPSTRLCVWIFSTTLSKTFRTLRQNSEILSCGNVYLWSTRYSCRILTELEFYQQIFEKCWNIKFNKNPPSGSRVVPCGRTDGWKDRHEANSRFSKFCKRA